MCLLDKCVQPYFRLVLSMNSLILGIIYVDILTRIMSYVKTDSIFVGSILFNENVEIQKLGTL